MNAIEIKNLTKEYKLKDGNTFKALDNVSLNIKKGSFFGLLGPNGAGKSTLINTLASLVKKTSGEILISNIDFDKNNALAKSKLGIVPQEINIDPFFSVKESLEIYAGYYGVPKKQRKTNEIITALGLKDKQDANPRSLSGGMKRRLLVAKALVHDPDIIILDEPTAGVDVELREQLWEYVKELNSVHGKTIILTTHYLEEAEELCDEIAIINKGKIITHETKKGLKKLFGHKTLEITLSEKNKKSEIDNLKKDLEKIGKPTINNNIINIIYKDQDFSYSELVKILAKKKIEILNISTKESNIEDIFKDILKGNKITK
jgi:ABC-2 type transport system ATP-binding protein